jgi:hypothetical protein
MVNVHKHILLPENIEACPKDKLRETMRPSELTNDQAIRLFNVRWCISQDLSSGGTPSPSHTVCTIHHRNLSVLTEPEFWVGEFVHPYIGSKIW